MKFEEIEINWLGHAGFLIAPLGVLKNSELDGKNYVFKEGINSGGKVIYIDPYKIRDDLPKADIILITHGHYDHCSVEDLDKIVKKGTKIFLTADSQSKIARFKTPILMQIVQQGQEYNLGIIKISVVPAYNIDKPFHTKEEGLVGYLIKMNGLIIYHAGDSDLIPEMQKLTGHNQPDKKFVALLPVGGRFTMSAEEAAEAARLIKPSLAIPMHWGSIIGSKDDAEEFKTLCEENKIKCEILEKY
ncbi:MAG: MBL fold metallo-hydrolase [Nanoarchaeota archaeon]|nr:MBL fold metallo-hydrolase [Nanoarchaeota archaeon]